MDDLLSQLYEEGLLAFESIFRDKQVVDPRAEAIVVGILDGISILVGKGRPWEEKSSAVVKIVQEVIKQRYSE